MFKSKVLHLVTLLAIAIAVSAECEPEEYNYHPYISKVISNIKSHKRINSLSLVGSHHSAGYNTENPSEKTQELSIDQQLKAGIRVLHFNVKPDSQDLKIFSNNQDLNLKLNADILPIINEFLEKYPKEFVIVYLHQDEIKITHAEENCKIINNIKKSNSGSRILTNWATDDSVRMYYGKILLGGDDSFKTCTYNLQQECATDNYNENKGIDDVIYKWEAIKSLQELTFSKSRDCYVHRLYVPNNSQGDLSLISKTGGYKTSKGECARPLNLQMAKYFKHSPSGLTIVMADFVTQKLIDRINRSNFEN